MPLSSKYRSRNGPIINPFDQLDATSFDHFVQDVTTSIRDALNPTIPPRARPSSRVCAAFAAAAVLSGGGGYGNAITLGSPKPPHGDDDDDVIEPTRPQESHHNEFPSQLLQSPPLINGHRGDEDILHKRTTSTSGSKSPSSSTGRRTPSVIDLISSSDEEEEESEQPSISVPTSVAPTRFVYLESAGVDVGLKGETLSDEMEEAGGRYEDDGLDQTTDERQQQRVKLEEEEEEEESEREQDGYEEDVEDEVDDTFRRQISRARRIFNDDYADEDEDEETYNDRVENAYLNFEYEEEEEIPRFPGFPRSTYMVEGIPSSLPTIPSSKGKGRALDEGPGVKALHGISRRMEEHPELYMPSSYHSVPTQSDDSEEVSYEEEDGSGVEQGVEEEGNDGDEEEEEEEGDEVDELEEEIGRRRGYTHHDSDDEEQAQEQVYSGEEEEEGEGYLDRRRLSSPAWQVFDEDAVGEDEDEGQSEEEVSIDEHLPGGSGQAPSDPIVVDDDDDDDKDRETEDGPSSMLVDAPQPFQNDEEVGLSVSLTSSAAIEEIPERDQPSTQSTPLFGDYTDSQPESGLEDQPGENKDDLDGDAEVDLGSRGMVQKVDEPQESDVGFLPEIGLDPTSLPYPHLSPLPATSLLVPSIPLIANENASSRPPSIAMTEPPEAPAGIDPELFPSKASAFISCFGLGDGRPRNDTVLPDSQPVRFPTTYFTAPNVSNTSEENDPNPPEGLVTEPLEQAPADSSSFLDLRTPESIESNSSSGPVLPSDFAVEDTEPFSTFDVFQQSIMWTDAEGPHVDSSSQQHPIHGIPFEDIGDSGVDNSQSVGESLIGDIYLPRSHLSDGVSSPGTEEVSERHEITQTIVLGSTTSGHTPPKLVEVDEDPPLLDVESSVRRLEDAESEDLVQPNDERIQVCRNKDESSNESVPSALTMVPDPLVPSPSKLDVTAIEEITSPQPSEYGMLGGSPIDSVIAEPPSTGQKSPDIKYLEDLGRQRYDSFDSGIKSEREGPDANVAVGSLSDGMDVQGIVVDRLISPSHLLPIVRSESEASEAKATKGDVSPSVHSSDAMDLISVSPDSRRTIILENHGDASEVVNEKHDTHNEVALSSGLGRTTGPRFIPEVSITIPLSSQRQGDEGSVASTQRTPSEVGSTAPSRKRKRYATGGLDSPALNTRSRIKDVTEASGQASHSSPPLSPSSHGSENGRRYISARQLGHSGHRTSATSIHSLSPKPPPLRPYVSIPTTSSFHHHHKSSPTTERVPEKKARSSSITDSPITRSHCRFHKISVPSAEPGIRTYFIVPGCSLSAIDLMKEENIMDCGVATSEDNASKTTDLSKLDPQLVHVLRKLAGPDLIHEDVCGFLPNVSVSKDSMRAILPTVDPNLDDVHSGIKDGDQLSVSDIQHLEGKDTDSISTRSPKLTERRASHRKPRRSHPHSDLADYQPSRDESSDDESSPTQKRKRAQLREVISSRVEEEPTEPFPVALADTILVRERSSPKETESIAKASIEIEDEQEDSEVFNHAVPPTSPMRHTKRKRQLSHDPETLAYTPDIDGGEGWEEDEDEKPKGKKHRWKTAIHKDDIQGPTSDPWEGDESKKGEVKEVGRYFSDQSEDKSTPISEQFEAKPPEHLTEPSSFWRLPGWW